MNHYPWNRPSPKAPNPHVTVNVHCPLCSAEAALNGKQVNITLYRGSYTVSWHCNGCTQPVGRSYFTENDVALASLRKMSDAYLPINVQDPELEDPVRTGATTIDLKASTALSISAVEQAWKDFIGKYKSEHDL